MTEELELIKKQFDRRVAFEKEQKEYYKEQYEEAKEEIKYYKDKYEEVLALLSDNKPKKKNERNAGRKKLGRDKKTTKKLIETSIMIIKKKTDKEIMEELGISRTTLYRYKKHLGEI